METRDSTPNDHRVILQLKDEEAVDIRLAIDHWVSDTIKKDTITRLESQMISRLNMIADSLQRLELEV